MEWEGIERGGKGILKKGDGNEVKEEKKGEREGKKICKLEFIRKMLSQ